MKKLLLLILLPFTVNSQELIPSEISNLIGTNNGTELGRNEYHKLRTDFYKGYNPLKDTEGVYAIEFSLKNPNRLIDYLEENNFHKSIDIDLRYVHKIVYSSKDYEVKIFKDNREAYVYDFTKRKYEKTNDNFYGNVNEKSLRDGVFQEYEFTPSIEMDFIPYRDILRCLITFEGSKWLHSKEIKFSIDSGNEILSFPLEKISDDVQQGLYDVEISEKSGFELTPEDAKKLANAEDVKVRLVGETYFEFPLTKSQQFAIVDYLNL